MDFLRVLVTMTVVLGLGHCSWPKDCEVSPVSREWMEKPFTSPFLFSFLPNTVEWETKINISGKSDGCILTGKHNNSKFNLVSTCSNETDEVKFSERNGNIWTEIFITTLPEGKLWTALCIPTICEVKIIGSELRPPFLVTLSTNAQKDVDVVLNCPNAGCQMTRTGLVVKQNSKITSFFVSEENNFTGKINTKSSADNFILNSSNLMKSQWNQVYVICASSQLYVLVNGSVVINKTTAASNAEVSFVSFEVLSGGKTKWCTSDAPSPPLPWYLDYDPVTYTGWVSAALLFLLCLVLICCIACRQRKSPVINDSCVNPPTMPRCRAPTPERISITTCDMPKDEICLASEHIYDSWMDLEESQQSSRHDSESGSSCAGKAVKETSFMDRSEFEDVD